MGSSSMFESEGDKERQPTKGGPRKWTAEAQPSADPLRTYGECTLELHLREVRKLWHLSTNFYY